MKWSHIAVRADHASAALEKFKEAGFEPNRVKNADGEVRYSFKDVPEERLFALASAIPLHFYSKYAVVGDGPQASH